LLWELDRPGALDLLEPARPRREGLVDLLAVDRAEEVERVLAWPSGDEPSAIITGVPNSPGSKNGSIGNC
jgi:hypothetical protein